MIVSSLNPQQSEQGSSLLPLRYQAVAIVSPGEDEKVLDDSLCICVFLL